MKLNICDLFFKGLHIHEGRVLLYWFSQTGWGGLREKLTDRFLVLVFSQDLFAIKIHEIAPFSFFKESLQDLNLSISALLIHCSAACLFLVSPASYAFHSESHQISSHNLQIHNIIMFIFLSLPKVGHQSEFSDHSHDFLLDLIPVFFKDLYSWKEKWNI